MRWSCNTKINLKMWPKLIVLLSVFITLCSGQKNNYKICVAKQNLDACRQMVEVDTKSKVTLECVAARDRLECLYLVQQRQADFVPVDPEDMYVATELPNQDFVVFQEYRTDDEPDAEFRYEAVMVVHKDLAISNLDQLKGLKSCHTGVNRNVGYKIPLTKLMKRSAFPKMNDRSISPKENELKAYSSFFNKSCIVGKWSPDDKTNAAWKAKYSNLCAMCEDPLKCDYPDNYSGYQGAIRCLAHNHGDVAFTKVIFVRKFFGLPVGTIQASQSSENPDEFRYLCEDGSKVPIREKACSWASRPWQGLLGHNDVLARISPLRQKIKQLSEIGASSKPDWFTKVLGLSEKIHHVADNIPISPADYLSKANYTDVIERGHGPPEPIVRLCVITDVELSKCRTISDFAFSRDIRPRLDCIQQASETDCLKTVRDNGADFYGVDGTKVAASAKKYNLHPVFHEVYGKDKTPPYAVVVVKKGSGINSIEDLRGKKSCHSDVGTYEGADAPIYILASNNLTAPDQCPRIKILADFFSGGSCLPGADKLENNPTGVNLESLTRLCRSSPQQNNPFQCLKDGIGDVAFMSSLDLGELNEEGYELLCPNKPSGGRDELPNYGECNVAIAPSRAWLAAKDYVSDVAIAHTPLSLAQLLEDDAALFNMYGEYLKNDNVIFTKRATGLATTETFNFNELKTVHEANNDCV